MRSCERPRKRSASEALPSSVSKRYCLSIRTHGSSCRRRASRVVELGCPIARAARQKIEDVPERAEVIAGLEGRIGHAENPLAFALEHGDARQPATVLRAIAHVLGEGRALMAHHRELPAAACGEALLHFWWIGARNDHRRAVQQMVI